MVTVLVMDEVVLDTLLKAKWEGMKAALVAEDIAAAMEYFSEDRKDAYQAVFTTLSDQIGNIISNTSTIEAVAIIDGKARYVIN
jgi:hypothetical protein